MRMPRFSIAGLLAFVLVCGLGLAALKAASGLWASLMVTLAAVALLTSIVGAAKGRNRAGWLGFAVFSWGYVIVNFAPWCQDVIHPHLLTTAAIVESYRHLHPKPPALTEAYADDPVEIPSELPSLPTVEDDLRSLDPNPRYVLAAGVGPARVLQETKLGGGKVRYQLAFGPGDYHAYTVAAHAILTILVGVLGWIVAAVVADRRPEEER
jgi:hypothetical protein